MVAHGWNVTVTSPKQSCPNFADMTQEITSEPADEVDEATLDTMTATKETLEDYTLRFAPRSYRKWSTGVVGVSALGGIAYLADFAIGANIGIAYGTTNALWGILDLRRRHHADRFPGGLLRRALQHRPRPGHPRQRLRLLRVGGHQRHLRDVHLHLLRARGLDHGPGPANSASAYRCGSATRRRR